MAWELPLACTLDAAGVAERAAQLDALGRDALLGADRHGSRAVLRFRRAPGIEQRLRALVAAESECCPFFEMAVDERPEALVLSVSAPAEAAPVLEELVAALCGGWDSNPHALSGNGF